MLQVFVQMKCQGLSQFVWISYCTSTRVCQKMESKANLNTSQETYDAYSCFLFPLVCYVEFLCLWKS